MPAAAATVYTLRPELFVRETYDDNVDQVNENRRDDFITTVGAGLSLLAATPRLTGAAQYRFGVEFFAKGTQDQGQPTHGGSVSLTYQATPRLTLSLGDGIRYSRRTEPDASLAVPAAPPAPGPGPTPVPPPPAVEPGTIPTRSVRRLNNTALAALAYQYDPRTSLGAAYSYSITDFGAPDLVDTERHRASVSVARQVTRRDEIGAEYAFSRFSFDDPERDERNVHELLGTWQHTFSPEISGGLSAGVIWTDEEELDLALGGNASLTKRVGLTRYALGYSGSISADDGTGEVNKVDRVAIGLARDLSAHVTATLGGAFTRSEPLNGPSSPTHLYSATAGLEATLARWLQAGIAYSFERKEAPAADDSFRNNRVTVGLTVLLPAIMSRSF